MLPSLLTALLFAFSGVSGQRAATAAGSLRANALRLCLAVVVLGLITIFFLHLPLHSTALPWLLLSGVVGFGVGDVALFLAYPRLGTRLTLLINLCFAPIAGALGEWLVMGNTPTLTQGLWCLVILSGVGLAIVTSARPASLTRAFSLSGFFAALMAGAGQGTGAMLSRYAKKVALTHGDPALSGIAEAFVRSIPGCLFSVLLWQIVRHYQRHRATTPELPLNRHAFLWISAAACFGPIAGVSCFQWALSTATSGIVLSIISTTPILVMPLTRYMDGDKPGIWTLLGSSIAVTGVIGVLSFV